MERRTDENSAETLRLLERATQGDESGWSELVGRYRNQLRRMLTLRMDRRIQGRVDASDVIQESCLAAWKQLPEYLGGPRIPFYVWLRAIAGNKLKELHRRHLGTDKRDAGRDISLYQGSLPAATSHALAAQLLGSQTRASEAAIRVERTIRVQECLNALEAIDREVLALRHFEQLSNGETAEILGLTESAASKRYIRALDRLKDALRDIDGG